MTPAKGSERPPRTDRGGFSFLEVVVSLVISSYGVLALAGTAMYTARGLTLADLAVERASAVRSVLEVVKSQPFDSVSAGEDTLGAFRVAWSTVVSNPTDKTVLLVSTGPGLITTPEGPSISEAAADSLYYRVIRP